MSTTAALKIMMLTMSGFNIYVDVTAAYDGFRHAYMNCKVTVIKGAGDCLIISGTVICIPGIKKLQYYI